jgi:hypothetical protein
MLIVTGILSLTYDKDQDDVIVGIAREITDGNDRLAIDDDSRWRMIDTV